MNLPEKNYRLLTIDDNEAIHGDLKKIFLPEKPSEELINDEMLFFGVRNENHLAIEIDSAFQGQAGLDSLPRVRAESDQHTSRIRPRTTIRSKSSSNFILSRNA